MTASRYRRDMKSNSDIRPKRHAFILTIWAYESPMIWRGCLEHLNGERHYFQTLTDLKTLLNKAGWREPNISIKEPES